MRDIERTGKSQHLLLELGRKSSQHLRQLSGSVKDVSIDGDLDAKDKYGRIPVIASIPGTGYSLNSAMIEQGYAIALLNSPADNILSPEMDRLEELARKDGAGLWGTHPELMQAWSGRIDTGN